MTDKPYTWSWSDLREAVQLRDRSRCQNCFRTEEEVEMLDVHHVVPRGQGGSNRVSNLILLCRKCHNAAHGEGMAPRIQFYTNGEMTDGEFRQYRRLWDSFEVARYDEEDKCWYIPQAEVELVIEELDS